MPEFIARVRPATELDFPTIVKHYGENSGQPWNPFTSVERLSNIPIDGLLVAEIDGIYAGFLYWYSGTQRRDDFNVEKYAHIVEIDVVREISKSDAGLALLYSFYGITEKVGLYTVYVQVNERSHQLLRMYEDLGFTTYARTMHLRFTNPSSSKERKRSNEETLEAAVFMTELKEQCRSLLIAYEELEEFFDKVPPADLEEKRIINSKIWARLQSIMVSAAVISKLLWPNPLPRRDGADKRAILRARDLRKILGIKGMRSLLPVDVRNAFEHIDERLIEWLSTHPGNLPWGWSLSPFAKKEDEPISSANAFRYYNLNTTELRVGDSSCNLKEIIGLVEEIESHIWAQAQVFFADQDEWGEREKR